MMRIAHLTSVHERYDIRILLKQCRTLSAAGFDVTLAVADGHGDEIRDGVKIIDSGRRPLSRLRRMLETPEAIYREALELDCDIYHLHDPELVPIGMRLKKKGKRVIFDAHEDYVADIKTKPYLPYGTSHAVSFAYRTLQGRLLRNFDGIVSATPSIAASLEGAGLKSVVINNFPLFEEIVDAFDVPPERRGFVCYAGAITTIRGVPILVDAMNSCRSSATLALIGPFTEKKAKDLCMSSPGWKRTKVLGLLDRQAMRREMQSALAGVVTFLPAPNHVESQPNKMFEYMASGLAIIGSNFPRWKEIIEGNQCGICVNPEMPSDIARAIDYLFENQDEALAMGRRGREAILTRFNWNAEAKKLVEFYQSLG